jgi:hypothetical protein
LVIEGGNGVIDDDAVMSGDAADFGHKTSDAKRALFSLAENPRPFWPAALCRGRHQKSFVRDCSTPECAA